MCVYWHAAGVSRYTEFRVEHFFSRCLALVFGAVASLLGVAIMWETRKDVVHSRWVGSERLLLCKPRH